MFTVFAFGRGLDHMRQTLADQIDRPADIHIHHEVEVVQTEGISVAIEDLNLSVPD